MTEDEKHTLSDGPVVSWFENPDFVNKLIKTGISALIEQGSPNEEGLVRYEADGVSAQDAVRISNLVIEHNKNY